MRRKLFMLSLLFVVATAAVAMSYERARQHALFLTDKMAYELNLTEDQYEAAYEINLDYMMQVNSVDDLYGIYWTRRNLDLRYVLLDWQYGAYCNAMYFYKPLYWNAGFWHFRVYTHYPRRTHLYFGHPHFVTVYRGGHSWHSNGGRSWYHGRSFGNHAGTKNHHGGMRDRHDRGEWKKPKTTHTKPNSEHRRQDNVYGRSNDNRFQNGGTMHRGTNRGDRQPTQPRNREDSRLGNNGRESSTRTTVSRSGTRTNINTGSLERRTNTNPRSTFTPESQRLQRYDRPASTGSRSGNSSNVGSSRSSHGSGSSNSSSSSRGGSFGGRR